MRLGPYEVPGYHVGDCRALMAELPDESVDCVVTSPPFWGLRDYGTGTWDGGEAGCPHTFKPGGTARSTLGDYNNGLTAAIEKKVTGYGHATYRAVCGKCGAQRVDQQLGLEATPEAYVAAMVEVFREVRRVLRRDATLWLNLGDSYAGHGGCALGRGGNSIFANAAMSSEQRRGADATGSATRYAPPGLKPKDLVGIPWRVAFALQADGWWLRSDIIWAKPNPMPESVTDRPTKAHEYLFLLAKSESYHYDADAIRELNAPHGASDEGYVTDARIRPNNGARDAKGLGGYRMGSVENGRNRRSVWTIATEPTPDAHFATFPRKLVEPCILAGCPPGGVVLDPFGGSGTVGRVAEDLGRRWLLFDLSPTYAVIAHRKTAQMGLLVPRG